MCDPVTLTVLGLTSAGLTLYGSVKSGQAAEQAGQNAKVAADHNANLMEGAAADAVNRGEADANRLGYRKEALAGEQQAQLGASGLDVQSSSSMDLLLGSRAMADLDIATTRNNAAREAWGLKTRAQDTRRAGALAAQQGSDEAYKTYLAGGAQFAANVGSVGVGAYNAQQKLNGK